MGKAFGKWKTGVEYCDFHMFQLSNYREFSPTQDTGVAKVELLNLGYDCLKGITRDIKRQY
jgi:hypothetical protein